MKNIIIIFILIISIIAFTGCQTHIAPKATVSTTTAGVYELNFIDVSSIEEYEEVLKGIYLDKNTYGISNEKLSSIIENNKRKINDTYYIFKELPADTILYNIHISKGTISYQYKYKDNDSEWSAKNAILLQWSFDNVENRLKSAIETFGLKETYNTGYYIAINEKEKGYTVAWNESGQHFLVCMPAELGEKQILELCQVMSKNIK